MRLKKRLVKLLEALLCLRRSMSLFICPKCKKRIANMIYADEMGKWHSSCEKCYKKMKKMPNEITFHMKIRRPKTIDEYVMEA